MLVDGRWFSIFKTKFPTGAGHGLRYTGNVPMPIDSPRASATLLYSLAEHVQLRKDGWHDEAIKRVALCALYESTSGVEIEGLVSEVVRTLGITVGQSSVTQRLDGLLQDGSIVDNERRLFLSQSERIRLDVERSSAESVASECRSRLERATRDHGTTGTVTWESFVNELIVPMTNELGSRTFDLLRGLTPVHDTTASRAFIEGFPEEEREAVRDTVAAYLDPADANVRRHLLGYLTKYTLLSAGGLSSSEVDSLVSKAGDIELDVLIDTNVAFSMLKLHRNPMNDATLALLQLREHLGSGVSLRFHMLASTVDEAKRSLEGARRAAPRSSAPPAFEKAAEESGYLSGLLEGYFRARNANRLLSADSYFRPYIDAFESVIAEHQISILDHEDARSIARVQERTDNWMTYEKGAGRGKSRDQLEHDVLAIEVVRQKRGTEKLTASSARWWIVTLDLRLQSRERQDLAGSRRLPSTINPAELVQLVQLWVPRSAVSEQALVGAIRMPFAFYSYDPELEQSALRILTAVASIEGISGLDEGGALRVFQDATLRSQLAAATPGSDREMDAVATAAKRVDLEYRARAETAERELRRLQASKGAATPYRGSKAAGRSKNDVLRERDRLKSKVGELQDELRETRKIAAEVGAIADQSRDRDRSLHELAVDRATRRVAAIRVLAVLAGVIVAAGAGVAFFVWPDPTGRIGSSVAFVVGLVALVVQLLVFLPKRRVGLTERWVVRIESKLRRNAGLAQIPASMTATSAKGDAPANAG